MTRTVVFPGWLTRSALALAVFAAVLVVATAARRDGPEGAAPPPAGLPEAPHYHSLLVDPDDPDRLLLGTHGALYESTDAGGSWTASGLEGDVMSLARAKDGTLWAAGHYLLARSTDGGRTWTDVEPRGLPSLDVHGFAASRDVGGLLYAAVAGEGLYRSDDGGESFRLISVEVGADVVSLAETLDGVVVAADMEKGVVLNGSGDGREWVGVLDPPAIAVAASLPVDHDVDGEANRRLLATTPEGVLVTGDKGRTWRETLSLADGAGAVAWSPREVDVAYAVGHDRTLYRTEDAGSSWQPVRSGRQAAAAPEFRGSRPPAGIAAPDFTLRDERGETVRMRSLRGKAVAVTFLDSRCTDACPVIAGHVARALRLFSPHDRRRVAALAITTDPAADRPRSVRAFLRKTGAEGALRYLLGSERELRPIWNAFHIVPSADTGSPELHSAPVRIFDPEGVWVSTLHAGADLTPQNLAHDLRAALER